MSGETMDIYLPVQEGSDKSGADAKAERQESLP
jgi:hypothetical protein